MLLTDTHCSIVRQNTSRGCIVALLWIIFIRWPHDMPVLYGFDPRRVSSSQWMRIASRQVDLSQLNDEIALYSRNFHHFTRNLILDCLRRVIVKNIPGLRGQVLPSAYQYKCPRTKRISLRYICMLVRSPKDIAKQLLCHSHGLH